MERRVGEVFTYNGKTYQVVKNTVLCDGCAFLKNSACSRLQIILGNCGHAQRTDHEEVIFKEIKNMETKINITTILKDKPKGIKLYDLLRNIDLKFDSIAFKKHENIILCKYNDVNPYDLYGYSIFGTERGWLNGLQILLPSREMRDWSKFSWKRGDALIGNYGKRKVFFSNWVDDSYTKFVGRYCILTETESGEPYAYDEGTTVYNTNDFNCIKDANSVQCYINSIEKLLEGKLNLETLEIEKQSEFKDGDIVYADYGHKQAVFIVSGKTNLSEGYNSLVALDLKGLDLDMGYMSFFKEDLYKLRLATDEEKKQLFSALAKEGKVWIPEKKQIVDLKPKVELKPFDKVLVRDSKSDKWRVNLYGYKSSDGPYYCVYASWNYCIPYEGNEYLLGTTKNVGE